MMGRMTNTVHGVKDAETEFHCTTADLIAAVIVEGAKIPRGHRIALTSNILSLVPKLPINQVLMPGVDLPPKRDYKILIPEPPHPPVCSGVIGTMYLNIPSFSANCNYCLSHLG